MTNAPQPTLHPNAITILRLLGYGLIAYAAIDALAIFYPPNFTDPEWEIQLLGNLVERAPVPLLGFALVYLGSQTFSRWSLAERILVKASTFICLLLAIVFLLLIPLGIFDTKRVIDLRNEEATTRLEETNAQIDRLIENLERVDPDSIARIQAQVAAAGEQSQIRVDPQVAGLLRLARGLPFETDPTGAKEELLERGRQEVTSQKAQLERQVAAEQKRFRKTLLENSAKWNFSSLLTSALFFMMYRLTGWLRKLPLKKKKKTPQGI